MNENTWAQRARAALRGPEDGAPLTTGQKRQKRRMLSAVGTVENASGTAVVAIGAIVRPVDSGERTVETGAVIDASGRFGKRRFANG